MRTRKRTIGYQVEEMSSPGVATASLRGVCGSACLRRDDEAL